MKDYISFFARIQGGGTPMSNHELRRAISRGPFTELLDKLALQGEVVEALDGGKLKRKLKPDEVQELLLRYFAMSSYALTDFGKPSNVQQGLLTMNAKNAEMKQWSAGESRTKCDTLLRPLVDALKLLVIVFEKDELFRRPVPLVIKKKVQSPSRVWKGTGNVNKAIWDCLVYSFSTLEKRQHAEIRKNADEIRCAILDLFQKHPDFTDSLNRAGTPKRVAVLMNALNEILSSCGSNDIQHAQVSAQTRKDLIAEALKSNSICPLCTRQLSPFEPHLHVDHIIPRSKGGSNELSNLQVVHKTCNLQKSNNV